jgi:hypothetical protein
MGMLQTIMKNTPEGKIPSEYAGEVYARAVAQMDEDSGSSHDGCECWVLKPEQFDEYWESQENLKNTDEVREKYRKLTDEGRIIVLEMDW